MFLIPSKSQVVLTKYEFNKYLSISGVAYENVLCELETVVGSLRNS